MANILVTERDVESISVGDPATVSFDALQGLNFPAKITQIAPVATVSQGVVNYQVTAELTSTQPVSPTRSTRSASQYGNRTTSGNSGTPRARPSGRTPGAASARTPSTNPTMQSITLKDGLSATVTIPVQEKDNVLMIPSRAISHQGRTATVQLIKGTTTETQTVQTGITDGTNTEITSGLNEGDQVLIQFKTTTTNMESRWAWWARWRYQNTMISLKGIIKSYPMGKRELRSCRVSTLM